MPMQDTTKIKEDILNFLKTNGPSLPVQISRHIKIDTLFTSAFLSELLSNQQLKITNLKVGSSPVYYVSGTEEGLEKYSEYLKSKEREAYELLKENKFLEDSQLHPAIKVALRQIKDFAKAFEKNDKIIWRYYLISKEEYSKNKEEEIKIIQEEPGKKEVPLPVQKENLQEQKTQEKENISSSIQEKEKPIENTNPPINVPQEKPKELERILPSEEQKEFVNPLAKKETPKKQKEKPKSEFVQKSINFIQSQGWTIIEEISHKAKEYNCLIQISSDLGPIIFKTQAKDKKTISEADMKKLLGEAQSIPLPALILSEGTLQKKSTEFLDKYSSVIKFKQVK